MLIENHVTKKHNIFTGADFADKIEQNSGCSAADLAEKPIVGVIGDQRSDISVQVASLLRVFKIPLISYQSTSPTLSDRERFANFFRTVPSDVTQAYAILEILKSAGFPFSIFTFSLKYQFPLRPRIIFFKNRNSLSFLFTSS